MNPQEHYNGCTACQNVGLCDTLVIILESGRLTDIAQKNHDALIERDADGWYVCRFHNLSNHGFLPACPAIDEPEARLTLGPCNKGIALLKKG